MNVPGQSPRNWKKPMHQNAVPTIFHTQNICHHVWKIVRTTLQCPGRRSRKLGKLGTDLSHSFSTFHDPLPAIGEQRYIAM